MAYEPSFKLPAWETRSARIDEGVTVAVGKLCAFLDFLLESLAATRFCFLRAALPDRKAGEGATFWVGRGCNRVIAMRFREGNMISE